MSTWVPFKGCAVWMVNDSNQYEMVAIASFASNHVHVQHDDLSTRCLDWNDIEPVEIGQSSGRPLPPARLKPLNK